MPQLRIAVGYLTEHRASRPVVLASGYEPAALQSAIDQTGPDFLRFELGVFHFVRKGRRNGAAPVEVEPADSLDLNADNLIATIAQMTEAKEQDEAEIARLTTELAAAHALLSEAAKPSPEIPTTTEMPSEQATAPMATVASPSASPAVAETPVAEPAPSETAAESDAGDGEEGGPTLPALDSSTAGPAKGKRK